MEANCSEFKNLITVIVPVYNCEKTIEKTINSIINQIGVHIEIIIVNDGSTDNSKEICETISNNYDNVKVYNIENHGVSYSRNYALRRANGQYIGFVDADDYIESDMFKTLLFFLKKYNAQLSVCGIFNETEDCQATEKSSEKIMIAQGEEMYECLYKNPNIGGYLCNKLFVKDFILCGLDERYAQCEDFLFVAEYLKNIEKLVFVDKNKYHYIRKNDINCFAYSNRDLTLMPAYEQILHIYEKNAPNFLFYIKKNMLKIYLNFRARYKFLKDDNEKLKKQINVGINAYFKSVIFDKNISFKEKINIVLTYAFPKTIIKTKSFVLYRKRKNNKW